MAAQEEINKISEYSHLDSSYFFVPVAVETCGSFGPKAREFFQEVGRQVKRATQEENAYHYMIQRIAVAVQRGNVTSVLGTLGNQQNGLID